MKRSRIVGAKEAAAIAATYGTTISLAETCRIHKRSMKGVVAAMERHGSYHAKKCPRLDEKYVLALYARYQAGASLNALGREEGRTRQSIREMFQRRGLALREGFGMGQRDLATGRIIPLARLTDAKLAELAGQPRPRIMVPPEIRVEWREWPLEKRRRFIAQMRAHLNLPADRPDKPFSANVEPFEYGSTRAHAIADRLNAGLNSRVWKVHMKVSSQGVIWREELYFWANDRHAPGSGAYYASGRWTPERGRPSLHHIMWEELHGAVPASHVVRMKDGNPNNFAPNNLYLATRNDLARENQAAGLGRKSRELTRLLLRRNQTPKKKSHDLIDSLQARAV